MQILQALLQQNQMNHQQMTQMQQAQLQLLERMTPMRTNQQQQYDKGTRGQDDGARDGTPQRMNFLDAYQSSTDKGDDEFY